MTRWWWIAICALFVGLIISALVRSPAANNYGLNGDWVMVADNGGGVNGTVMTLSPDGTARLRWPKESKPAVWRYRSLPLDKWLFSKYQPKSMSDMLNMRREFDDVDRVVEFDQGQGFEDYGPWLLMYSRKDQTLQNPLVSEWVRPDAARAVALRASRK